MDHLLDAFRRAHKIAKAIPVEQAFGEVAELNAASIASFRGPWADQLLAQALLVLRQRGLPEPSSGPDVIFGNMVKALQTCQEIPHDDPDHPGRDKPAA
jgi:hypothetical protein